MHCAATGASTEKVEPGFLIVPETEHKRTLDHTALRALREETIVH
jgi:hypothetical protein